MKNIMELVDSDYPELFSSYLSGTISSKLKIDHAMINSKIIDDNSRELYVVVHNPSCKKKSLSREALIDVVKKFYIDAGYKEEERFGYAIMKKDEKEYEIVAITEAASYHVSIQEYSPMLILK